MLSTPGFQMAAVALELSGAFDAKHVSACRNLNVSIVDIIGPRQSQR